ncbi:MAG: ABC transporter permease [candidate division Zixibacteria bacterium]|nr:ABC transporter permease [candidate division Zixibacteria bacterium]
MRIILALIKKEFYQVFRDRNMLRLIFLLPMIQLIVLGYAINVDVKNIHTAVYDFDNSTLSREYVKSLSAGDYFDIEYSEIPLLDINSGFKSGQYDAALIIPSGFSSDITLRKPITAGFVVDAANANSAAIAMAYAGQITAQFNNRQTKAGVPIELRQKRLYNPEAESVYFMVPGIVAVLVTMITVMLTSMAIVRERETGTLEQLMVTPIKTPAFIFGKTIPFAILGYVEMSMALAFGILWFNIPFAGSWVLLYGLAFVFLFTTLGVGMFISTITATQQQAMFFAWFFSVFAIMTSGFFTPISNMPDFVQYITYLNPLRYFMAIVRGIMMKGAGVAELYREIFAMITFSAIIFTLSWMRFSKRIE